MALHLVAETESTQQRRLPLLLSIHADYSSSHRHSPPRLPHTHRTSPKERAIGGGSHTEAAHTWQKHHRLFVTCTNVFTCVSTHSNKCTRSRPERTRISLLSFLSTFEKIIIIFSLAVTQSKTSSLLQLAASPLQLEGDPNCEVSGISQESPKCNDLLSRYPIFGGIFFIIREWKSRFPGIGSGESLRACREQQ